MQVPICLYPYACFLDSKTGETTSKRRKGAKNSETAAKVALMKLYGVRRYAALARPMRLNGLKLARYVYQGLLTMTHRAEKFFSHTMRAYF